MSKDSRPAVLGHPSGATTINMQITTSRSCPRPPYTGVTLPTELPQSQHTFALCCIHMATTTTHMRYACPHLSRPLLSPAAQHKPLGLGSSALPHQPLGTVPRGARGLRRTWTTAKPRGDVSCNVLPFFLDLSLAFAPGMELFDAVKSSVDSEVVFQATLQVWDTRNACVQCVDLVLSFRQHRVYACCAAVLCCRT